MHILVADFYTIRTNFSAFSLLWTIRLGSFLLVATGVNFYPVALSALFRYNTITEGGGTFENHAGFC